MSRLTGSEAQSLMEAYNAVYAPQELTEEQIWEEVESWVNSLLEEGYDLSDYTWEEMYEAYLNEAPMTAFQAAGGQAKLDQLNKGRSPRAGRATAAQLERQGQENLFRAGGGNAAIAQGPTRNQNVRGGGSVKVPTLTRQDIINRGAVAAGEKPKPGTPPAPPRPGTPATPPRPGTPATPPRPGTPATPPRPGTPGASSNVKQAPTIAVDPARLPPAPGGTPAPAPTATPPRKSLAAQAAELRDMQKASQMRQQGANVMGSNITSVRQSLDAARARDNAPAPAGTALATQQQKQAMQNLKKPSPNLKMSLDLFDIVKGHLLDEGYADNEDAALAIMANMSEDWKQSIVEAQEARNNPEEYERKEAKKKSKKQRAMEDPHTGINSPAFEKFMRQQMGR